jgi:hypothetical protein
VIEKLRNDHLKLRQMSANLLEIVRSEEPADLKALSICRWELARLLLQHLPVEDRHVYRRLESDPRPTVSALAKKFRTELESSYDRFKEHTDRWTGEAIVADWAGYRTMVSALIRAMLDRIDREETMLYPLLTDAPAAPERQPTDRNWAGDGWSIREKIEKAAKTG